MSYKLRISKVYFGACLNLYRNSNEKIMSYNIKLSGFFFGCLEGRSFLSDLAKKPNVGRRFYTG